MALTADRTVAREVAVPSELEEASSTVSRAARAMVGYNAMASNAHVVCNLLIRSAFRSHCATSAHLPIGSSGSDATCVLSLSLVRIRGSREWSFTPPDRSGEHMTEKSARGEIFVVDDDPDIRRTLSVVLSDADYDVICFADGAALLAIARTRCPVCIFLDVHIPGQSGLDILKELHAEAYSAPIFMMSGKGDIAMAVEAIKNGALDFIEKPFRASDIVATIEHSVSAFTARQKDQTSRTAPLHFPGREPLTARERDVLDLFSIGATNKDAGRQLGISPRTIEFHRSNIMKKLGAKTALDLIQIVLIARNQT
jgi:FixJ family two-component response regulator